MPEDDTSASRLSRRAVLAGGVSASLAGCLSTPSGDTTTSGNEDTEEYDDWGDQPRGYYVPTEDIAAHIEEFFEQVADEWDAEVVDELVLRYEPWDRFIDIRSPGGDPGNMDIVHLELFTEILEEYGCFVSGVSSGETDDGKSFVRVWFQSFDAPDGPDTQEL